MKDFDMFFESNQRNFKDYELFKEDEESEDDSDEVIED